MPQGHAKNPKEKSRKISLTLKGKPKSKEHKLKLSLAKIGRKLTNKQLENLKLGRVKGKHWKLSEEIVKKMSERNRGKKKPPFSKEHIANLRKSHIGKSSGSKNWNWKGGITPLRVRIWHSYKYRQWRSDIFTKDDFICQNCGKNKCYLEAHHIKEFSKIMEENNIKTFDEAMNCEELWNINNGITLCKECHNLTKKGR